MSWSAAGVRCGVYGEERIGGVILMVERDAATACGGDGREAAVVPVALVTTPAAASAWRTMFVVFIPACYLCCGSLTFYFFVGVKFLRFGFPLLGDCWRVIDEVERSISGDGGIGGWGRDGGEFLTVDRRRRNRKPLAVDGEHVTLLH
jgi:hypothetical protein